MAKVVLYGATEVGEMALFSVGALPREQPSPAALSAMEGEGSLICLPAKSASSHVLAAYVDERVPEKLLMQCLFSEARSGRLRMTDGRLGFGGSETLCTEFESDDSPHEGSEVVPVGYHEEAEVVPVGYREEAKVVPVGYREEAEVMPGDYEVTVFPTDSANRRFAARGLSSFAILALFGLCGIAVTFLIVYHVAGVLGFPLGESFAFPVFVIFLVVSIVLKVFGTGGGDSLQEPPLDRRALDGEDVLRRLRERARPTIVAQMWRRGDAGMDGA